MRGRGAWLLGLTLVAAARPAAGQCPPMTSATATLADEAARLVHAAEQARPGGCLYAADLLVAAHAALSADPRRDLDALHAVVTDAVNMYAAVHELDGDPALLCEADALVVRHRQRVRSSRQTTFAFEAEVNALRTRLHARLGPGERCVAVDPGMVALARRSVAAAAPGEPVLRPGVLAAATRDHRRPASPSPRRWPSAKRAGVAMLALGLMTLGAGIAAGSLERVDHRDLLQASLLVGGTGLFVGGFPLLIIGDQRARAAVALAPGGAAVRF